MADEYRARRSCLAVPGSSQRFLDKARGLAADEVFLDLEDAVAEGEKPRASSQALPSASTREWLVEG